MDVDPLASMRCWAIEIELGGRTYEVPALPAVDWWPILVSGDLTQILDFVGSTPDDPFNLDDLLLSGQVDAKDLGQVAVEAIEEVCGRSFHTSFVLATVAAQHWASINGELARSSFRWDEQPIGAALDAIYLVITGRLEKAELEKFLELLDNESLTQPGKKRQPSQRVRDEFEAMAGPKPTSGAVASGPLSGGEHPRTPPPPRQPRQGAR